MNTNNKLILLYVNNYILANCFNYKNPYNIKGFDKLVINIRINTSSYEETSSIFPKAVWLLEHLTVQKPFVPEFKTKRIGRNQRRIFFSTKISLRNLKIYNFIYFYNCLFIKLLKKKGIFFNEKINKNDGNFMYTLKDINVFPGYLEDFFKWPYFIHFNFILKDFDSVINKTVLQNLGIFVK